MCTCAYLHANGSEAVQLLIWFEFGAFVMHGVPCATHSRLTCGFTLETNILKTHLKNDIIIIIIKNIGPNSVWMLNDYNIHIHEIVVQGASKNTVVVPWFMSKHSITMINQKITLYP